MVRLNMEQFSLPELISFIDTNVFSGSQRNSLLKRLLNASIAHGKNPNASQTMGYYKKEERSDPMSSNFMSSSHKCSLARLYAKLTKKECLEEVYLHHLLGHLQKQRVVRSLQPIDVYNSVYGLTKTSLHSTPLGRTVNDLMVTHMRRNLHSYPIDILCKIFVNFRIMGFRNIVLQNRIASRVVHSILNPNPTSESPNIRSEPIQIKNFAPDEIHRVEPITGVHSFPWYLFAHLYISFSLLNHQSSVLWMLMNLELLRRVSHVDIRNNPDNYIGTIVSLYGSVAVMKVDTSGQMESQKQIISVLDKVANMDSSDTREKNHSIGMDGVARWLGEIEYSSHFCVSKIALMDALHGLIEHKIQTLAQQNLIATSQADPRIGRGQSCISLKIVIQYLVASGKAEYRNVNFIDKYCIPVIKEHMIHSPEVDCNMDGKTGIEDMEPPETPAGHKFEESQRYSITHRQYYQISTSFIRLGIRCSDIENRIREVIPSFKKSSMMTDDGMAWCGSKSQKWNGNVSIGKKRIKNIRTRRDTW